MNAVSVDASRPPVVRVTLSSPGTGNRLDEPLLAELSAALTEAEATPGAQVLVLGAAGDAFCAGMALDGLESAWRPRIEAVGELLTRLTASPLVTVALVDGAALGGGVGLAAACDQVIAGPRAEFRMTEVLLGLLPATILPVVARRIGAHRAYGLALTAREVPGAEAVGLGLADATGGEDELRRVLRRLRAADPGALAAFKAYYAELFPPLPPEELVVEVLGRRLADAQVHQRIAGLRNQGLIP
ncbi:enoyl-CoA hydratase/isomerase family protein [Saccharopolyspora sp. NPDC050642]|uniref:enoyl-CoA hydratase/isomerase family protein n=1 Tax=Saccharopolyspora sp. NPDC050642 TaxID=3157099 RepID=UPI0033D7C0DE